MTQHFRIAAFLLLLLFVSVGNNSETQASGLVLAQTTTPPAPASNVSSGRSYTFEIAIVVVLFGGALFAVCRSSNRV